MISGPKATPLLTTTVSFIISIEEETSAECLVTMSASPCTKLPDMKIVFNSHYHSTLEIKGLLEDPLQFSRINLQGSTAMMWLNNTAISKSLTINLEYGRLYLNNIIPNETRFNIQVPKGLVDIQIHPQHSPQFFNVSQTYGAICLSGGDIAAYNYSQECPSEQERKLAISMQNG